METLLGIALTVLAAAIALRILTAVSKLAIVLGLIGVIALTWFHPTEVVHAAHGIGHGLVHAIERAVG